MTDAAWLCYCRTDLSGERIDDVFPRFFSGWAVARVREIRKRSKKPSKKFRDAFGHTPLSIEEEVPWQCRRLVIGTGTGALPVMKEVKRESKRRKIKLLILPTRKAIQELKHETAGTNAILHVTC